MRRRGLVGQGQTRPRVGGWHGAGELDVASGHKVRSGRRYRKRDSAGRRAARSVVVVVVAVVTVAVVVVVVVARGSRSGGGRRAAVSWLERWVVVVGGAARVPSTVQSPQSAVPAAAQRRRLHPRSLKGEQKRGLGSGSGSDPRSGFLAVAPNIIAAERDGTEAEPSGTPVLSCAVPFAVRLGGWRLEG